MESSTGVDPLQEARRCAAQAHGRLVEHGPVHPTVASSSPRPVGEVHVGIASTSAVVSREHHFGGTRGEIRAAAAAAAVADLVAELDRHVEQRKG